MGSFSRSCATTKKPGVLPFILQISLLCQDGSIRYCPGFEGNPDAERVNAGARYLSEAARETMRYGWNYGDRLHLTLACAVQN